LDYVYGFIFLAALELILILFRTQWIKIALLAAALVLASVGALWLTVKLIHWYVNPVPVGLTAVGVKLVGVLFHQAEEEATASPRNTPPISTTSGAIKPTANP